MASLKKIIVNSIIFCFVLCVFCVQDIYSQDNSSECNCPEGQWSAPPVIYTSAACQGSITFVSKYCDGVYIVKILNFSGLNPNIDMINLQGCLLYELIKNNPMMFPPSTPEEGTKDWKIVRSSCWSYANSEKQLQVPCDNPETCCFTKLKVRKEALCGFIISIVDENGTLIECPPFGVNEQGCMDTCIPTKLPNPLKVTH